MKLFKKSTIAAAAATLFLPYAGMAKEHKVPKIVEVGDDFTAHVSRTLKTGQKQVKAGSYGTIRYYSFTPKENPDYICFINTNQNSAMICIPKKPNEINTQINTHKNTL